MSPYKASMKDKAPGGMPISCNVCFKKIVRDGRKSRLKIKKIYSPFGALEADCHCLEVDVNNIRQHTPTLEKALLMPADIAF